MEEARGRIGEALRWNTAQFARDPDSRTIYANRGRLLMILGLPERVREYEAALIDADDARRARCSRGWTS